MSQSDVSTILEQERRRLAAILNDDVISSLELIQAQTQTYLQALLNNQEAQLSLTVLQSLIQQTIQKTRYVQSNLNPTILETQGLEPALETFAADAKRVRGLTIELTTPRLRERLPPEIEVTLFRAVQTLIETATNQARATQFDVRLEQSDLRIIMHYEDNGLWQASHIRLLQPIHDALTAINGRADFQLEPDRHLLAKIQVTITETLALTPRETEIMQLVADGLTNKEVASELSISARTVNFHLDNVYSKLAVGTRTEAVMVALQRGWIENPVK